MAVGGQDETPETWGALLAGLSELCLGVGMALQHELCEQDWGQQGAREQWAWNRAMGRSGFVWHF